MSKTNWTEFICDYCGNAEQYLTSSYTDTQVRLRGWIITRDKKHYCSKECYKDDKAKDGNNEQL